MTAVDRDAHEEGCSPADFGLEAQGTPMPGNDGCVGDRQTLPRAATYRLGREKRVENLARVFWRDSAPVIAYSDFRHAIRGGRTDRDQPGGRILP